MDNYYVYEWIRLDTNEPFYVGKGSGDRWNNLTRGNNNHFNNIVKSIPVAVNILHDNLKENEAFQYECWYINEYKNWGFNLTNLTDGGDNPPVLSGEKNGNYNNFWSKEQRRKATERMLGKYVRDKNPKSRRIMCIENGEIFDCIRDAIDIYGGTDGLFTSALNNKRKMAHNLHWCYITNENIQYMQLEENRFKYLIESYLERKTSKAIICLETKYIYQTKCEFLKNIKISARQLDKFEKLKDIFQINNYSYAFIDVYNSCLIQ